MLDIPDTRVCIIVDPFRELFCKMKKLKNLTRFFVAISKIMVIHLVKL